MGGPEEPVFRWHEPAASHGRVLVLGTVAAGLLALAVVTLVVDNWDVAVVSGVLGLAAAADLWGDLRPRGFVLAGDDGLVVGHRGRTTVTAWADVAGLRAEGRRLRRDRPVVDLVDGTTIRLPAEVPLAEIERRRPGTSG